MLHRKKIHLICLPYSGGSSFAFKPLSAYWPKTWKQTTLSFPGRGYRIAEPLIHTMEEMVEDAWQQVRGDLDQPYAFLGHSMGATVAYLLAHKIREEGGPMPFHLFLTGTDAPSIPCKKPHRYLFSKEAFKGKLRSYGGTSDEILNDDFAFDFFEPIIRTDFKIVETWQYSKKPPLDVTSTVITGTEEGLVEENIRKWQNEFVNPVTFLKMTGRHFFLFEDPEEFLELIKSQITGSLTMSEKAIIHIG